MKLIYPVFVIVAAFAFFAGVMTAYARVASAMQPKIVERVPAKSSCSSVFVVRGARKQPYCVEV